ncbi:MAG: hypothetical protein M1821_002553 [Bathelium mastoideum]|nr:MAG: hypothetical protein M1821_002553 [Bathelium mastoideum]
MHFLQFATACAAVASAATIPAKKRNADASNKLEFFGVNESGAEFGTAIPGVYNTDYTWYDLSTYNTWVSQGANIFRVNFMMERLTPGSITAAFDQSYLGNLTQQVNYITQLGAYALICPHNYGRFNNEIITDTSAFQTFWQNLAAEYKSNSLVMFDTNNEYNTEDTSLVVQMNQAAINGIRAAGATSQYITPEGNQWTGAWSWTTGNGETANGAAGQMGSLTDPENKLIYQMHQYLDSDYSGTSADCQSGTILSQSLADATAWLRSNGKVAIIGELGAGDNALCQQALDDGLSYMAENSDVWKGALWWAAGPWWGTYIYGAEPTSGVAYPLVQGLLSQY